MATKAQELEALARIQKIVQELGENSYVGTAFEGCFEIASDNIECDFLLSMKQTLEKVQKEASYFNELQRSSQQNLTQRKRNSFA